MHSKKPLTEFFLKICNHKYSDDRDAPTAVTVFCYTGESAGRRASWTLAMFISLRQSFIWRTSAFLGDLQTVMLFRNPVYQVFEIRRALRTDDALDEVSAQTLWCPPAVITDRFFIPEKTRHPLSCSCCWDAGGAVPMTPCLPLSSEDFKGARSAAPSPSFQMISWSLIWKYKSVDMVIYEVHVQVASKKFLYLLRAQARLLAEKIWVISARFPLNRLRLAVSLKDSVRDSL